MKLAIGSGPAFREVSSQVVKVAKRFQDKD